MFSQTGGHFFLLNIFRPSITSTCSAKMFLSFVFSASSDFGLLASDTCHSPKRRRYRKNVCSVMLRRRHTCRICAPGASACLRIRMTWYSVNRFLICKPSSKKVTMGTHKSAGYKLPIHVSCANRVFFTRSCPRIILPERSGSASSAFPKNLRSLFAECVSAFSMGL